MKKTYERYLDRSVAIAINLRASETILETISRMKAAKVPVYALIRDIVSDVRFYSVTESDTFWRKYSFYHIRTFIDGLQDDDWRNDHTLTGKKEDFLNNWFAENLFFISEEEKAIRLKKIRADNNSDLQSDGSADGDTEVGEGDDGDGKPHELLQGVYDCSNCNENIDDEYLPEELQEYMMSQPGRSHGETGGEEHTAEAKFLNSIDPEIVRLANMIGRTGSISADTPGGRFLRSSKSDISGIIVGDDLNCVLPAELALLGDKATENIFLHRYSQKRLQVFASASHSRSIEKKEKGPIFMCIDTSGSMEGEPEMMAKTLALAVAIVAQRQNRPLVLINYSHIVSFFFLQKLGAQKKKLIRFLARSYAGGNDENRLFRFVFHDIYEIERYKTLSGQFVGADLLVISDFLWGRLMHDVKNLLAAAHSEGMRFYAVSTREMSFPQQMLDEEIDNGDDFFNSCDRKFIYSYLDGLREVDCNPKRKKL